VIESKQFLTIFVLLSEDKMSKKKDGLSRRGFITAVGAGAVGTAALANTKAASAAVAPKNGISITLNINGRDQSLTVEPRYTLLYVIRDMLGLSATKIGCERGECGSCTVLIDGKTQYAFMTLAVEAEGHKIITNEGLMDGENLGLVQQAFVEEDAFQCGYCTPGQVVAMDAMLRDNPQPNEEEIKVGMSGNICRCGDYRLIFNAANNAAEKIKSGGAK
jgi:xanthine dehydrogenase YagT iron-sulfur-binding subunit